MSFLAAFLLLSCALLQPGTASNSTSPMETVHLVPDVIDTLPAASAQVIFPSGVHMSMGAELTPTQVKDRPLNVTYPTEPNRLYALTFDDPDVPNRQNRSKGEFLHWLLVNIPGTELSKGETYTEYVGSGPALGSAFHRYTLLIFKQPGRLILNRTKVNDHSKEGRIGFKVRTFAAQYGLGSPVAGNFFHAQYDDWVPNIERQLSGK